MGDDDGALKEVRSVPSIYYYDPYAKRVIEVPLTNFDAFISLLKCVIGTGILAMPLAFGHSGILLGVIFSLILVFVLTYSIHLLISGMTECCRRVKRPQVSMPEAVKIACSMGPDCFQCLANAAGVLTSLVLVFGQFNLCTVYLVFVAKNFKEIGDYYWMNVNERFYVLGVCLLLFPFFMIRTLKYLVPLNLISNLLLYAGFILIMYYLVRGLPNINSRAWTMPPGEWLIFFDIAAFSLTAVGSMIVVEANMAHPQQYLGTFGVLNMAVFFILITNVLFGIMGYWRFGENVLASISLNLPQNEFVSQFVKISIASGIFLSYPLNGYVAITVIFSDYGPQNQPREFYYALEYAARIVFLLLSGIVAVSVPNLAALTELEGAFSLSILNFFCPALIDALLNYGKGYGKLYWKLIRDILLIIISIIFGIVGCAVAIKQLVDELKLALCIGSACEKK